MNWKPGVGGAVAGALVIVLLLAAPVPARSEAELAATKPPTRQEQKQRDQARRLFEKGRADFEQGDWKKAEKNLLKALALDPALYEARKTLGRNYLMLKQPAAGFNELAKYLAAFPDDTETMLTAGILGQQLNQSALARSYLETGLARKPEDIEARLALARLNLAEGQNDDAREHLEAILQRDPNQAEVHLLLGRILAQSGERTEAEAHWQRAAELIPQNAEANYLLGKMAFERGDLAGAIAPLSRAGSGHEPKAEVPYLLAIALLAQGQNDAALENFEKALQADPDYEQAGYQAGRLWHEKGDKEKAIARLSAFAGSHADHFAARWELARIYLEPGDFAQALPWLEQAARLEPNNAKVLQALGKGSYEKGDYIKAYPVLRRALALDPQNTDTRYLLGATYLHLPDLAAAERELQWILSREDKPEAKAMLEEIKKQRGDLSQEPSSGEAVSPLKTVAVIEFKDAGSDSGYDWLPTGLSEMMLQDLLMVTSLQAADPAAVDKLLREDALPAGSTSPAFKRLGAEALLTGSYTVRAGQIQLVARLVETETTRLIASGHRSGPLTELVDLERDLLLELISQYVSLTPAEREAILRQPGLNLASLENLSRGKKLYYLGKGEKAQEYLQKVVDSNPNYAPALSDLKTVQDALSNAETLAILSFKNTTGNPAYDWMGLGIGEALTTDLKKITGIYLVERNALDQALEELKLGLVGIVDEASAPKVGKMVGAGVILVGSYQVVNKRLRIDARLVDVETGAILLTEKMQGAEDDIFAVEEQLAVKISQALNVSLTAEEMARLKEKPNIEKFKSYIIAQSSFRVGKEGEPAKEGEETIRTVAVSKFKNYSGAEKYAFLEEAISGSLVTELKQRAGMNLIERDQLDQALAEMKLAETTYVDEKTAPKLGQMVGADAVLVGFFQVQEKSIRVDTRVIKVDTGEVLKTVSVNGDVDNIFKVETDLASQVMAALGVQGGATAAGQGLAQEISQKSDKEKRSGRSPMMAATYSFFLPGSSQYFINQKKTKGLVMFAADALLILGAAGMGFMADQAMSNYSSSGNPGDYNDAVSQLNMRNMAVYGIIGLGMYSAVDGYLGAKKANRAPPAVPEVVAESQAKP